MAEERAHISDADLVEHPFSDPYVNQFIRCNNTITAGIVGLPNSGKSSLFNLLTGEDAMTDPYLFCTIGRQLFIFFMYIRNVYSYGICHLRSKYGLHKSS